MIFLLNATDEQNAVLDALLATPDDDFVTLAERAAVLLDSLQHRGLAGFAQRFRDVGGDKDRVEVVMRELEEYCNYHTSQR